MEVLTTLIHIKDNPEALLILLILLIYKILSLVFTFVKDRYFSKPNNDIQVLIRDISVLKIHDKDLSIEERMESLFNYLYKGFNGETLEYGIKELILPHKKEWEKIYRKKIENSEDFNPKKNFEVSMQTINQIYDRRLT